MKPSATLETSKDENFRPCKTINHLMREEVNMLDSRLIPNVTVPAFIWRSAMAQPEAALSAIVEMMDGKPKALKSK